MKYLAFTWLIFIILHKFSLAAVYYVDVDKGNDSNSGKSENSPWKTIGRVNSASFSAGDNILFKSGGTWREQLNIKASGSKNVPVTVSAYGKGERPVISGADIIQGFQQHSGSVWKKAIKLPRQVFFDNTRGVKKNSPKELRNEGDWYHDNSFLYIMAFNPSDAYSALEAAYRTHAIHVTGDNIIIKNIRVEKTFNDAIMISENSDNVIIDNVEFHQWTNEIYSARAGAALLGSNCVVKNSVFGKKTGNDLEGQNWAGYLAIYVSGKNNECYNNKIYHNSLENESPDGKFAYGIRIFKAGGLIKIHGNFIYHTASNGILVDTYTNQDDEIRIYDNEVSHAGQAGISTYKTRGSDGKGGKGYIYNNKVSYANRLGGEKGGGGNRAAGIHFNDGLQKDTEPSKPFMKWYCYENTVHDSRSENERNSPDSDGIAIDYNANNVEVYSNKIYNNDGKGIYIWNADRCSVYYNIVYGNDCGITVSAADNSNETADYNVVFNNVFYKNNNGSKRGKNYDTEIYFGQNGSYNKFINNILYASKNGTAYFYNNSNTKGCLLDYNVIYSESGSGGAVGSGRQKDKKTFSQWKKDFPYWDKNSIHADPQFVNAAAYDFRLKPGSPALKKGVQVRNANNKPDIGAFENNN